MYKYYVVVILRFFFSPRPQVVQIGIATRILYVDKRNVSDFSFSPLLDLAMGQGEESCQKKNLLSLFLSIFLLP